MEAFRLRTLPLSFSSILAGSALALQSNSFNWSVFSLTLLTTLFLQVLSNLANDYGDAIHGADHEFRKGPDRMVSSGRISMSAMRNGLIVFSTLSFISGCILLFVTFDEKDLIYAFLMFVIGLTSIWAAIKYTAGRNPYGYIGLGDLFVLIFFGWVGVAGSTFLQTKSWDWMIMLPATALGFLAVGVLNVNNMRDIESDKLAGKYSIPVRIGLKNAVIYHLVLVFGAIALLLVHAYFTGFEGLNWIFLAATPILILHLIKILSFKQSEQFDPQLKVLALGSFVLSLLLFIGWV